MSNRIRLVSFDALHTLLTPRKPIYVQYSETFAPFIGVLDPDSIQLSFQVALKQLQSEKPAYRGPGGADSWWGDVIQRTALGAGADDRATSIVLAVADSITEIVPRIMSRFSSKEGYKLFDDVIPVLNHLNSKMKISTALVSNADSRIRSVLEDLDILHHFDPVVLSEEVATEKPSRQIFLHAMRIRHISNEDSPSLRLKEECLHVGDDLKCDYQGALDAGMHALLLRRSGPAGQWESKDEGENLTGVKVIKDLWEVVEWLKQPNKQANQETYSWQE